MSGSLFDYAEGRRLAVEGADRAHGAAADAWKAHAEATVLEVGRFKPMFTADDVIRWCVVRNLPLPEKAAAWGTVFRCLAADGRIEATGAFVNSERSSRHSAPLRVWRLTCSAA